MEGLESKTELAPILFLRVVNEWDGSEFVLSPVKQEALAHHGFRLIKLKSVCETKPAQIPDAFLVIWTPEDLGMRYLL